MLLSIITDEEVKQMANFTGRTSSKPCKVTDPEAVQAILDKYTSDAGIGEPEVVFELRGDELNIWGYDWIGVDIYDDDGEYNPDGLDKIIEELQPYIEDELVIHCIGGERCRFPLSAMQFVITKDKIVERTLDGDDAGIIEEIKDRIFDLHSRCGDDEMELSFEEIRDKIYGHDVNRNDSDWINVNMEIVSQIELLITITDRLSISVSDEYRRYIT